MLLVRAGAEGCESGASGGAQFVQLLDGLDWRHAVDVDACEFALEWGRSAKE